MAIVTGTDAAEVLVGTAGDDVISALGDGDIVQISTGHDIADGGLGYDTLELFTSWLALPAPHLLTLTADRLTDSTGMVDTSFTAFERFYLDDPSADVTLDATTATIDLLLRLRAGTHSIHGGAGNDDITVAGGAGSIDGGAGNDVLNWTVDITASTGTITATQSGTTISFSRGDGPGLYASNFESLTLNARGGGLTVNAAAVTTGLSFKQTDFADSIVGGAGNDVFFSTSTTSGSGDVFAGNGGADLYSFADFTGFAGATITDLSEADEISLTGFSGAYTFIGARAFSGTAGEVRFERQAGQTLLIGDRDGDGVGESVLTLSGSFQLAETALGSKQLHRVAEVITGTDDGETINGTTADQTILALGGDDHVRVSRGLDVLDGGAGSDWLELLVGPLGLPAGPHQFTITNDRITGGGGTVDTSYSGFERFFMIEPSASDVTIDASAVTTIDLNINLSTGVHDVKAGALGDQISVIGGSGTFDGGAGNDLIWLKLDNTVNAGLVTVSQTGATVTIAQAGGATSTTHDIEQVYIAASGGPLRVDASATSGTMYFDGTVFADTIVSGAGNDQIFSATSGSGAGDILTGGAGNDIFGFWTFGALDGATVTDFGRGDQIDVRLILGSHFIGEAGFSGSAGEIRYERSAGQTLLIGDADGDGSGDSVLTLSNRAVTLRETYAGSDMLQAVVNQITGTNAGEIIFGTTGDDDIFALGGQDAIKVSKGIDTVDGGTGTDAVELVAQDLALAAGPHGYTVTAGRITDTSGAIDTSFTAVEQVRLFDWTGSNVTLDASALTGAALTVNVRAGTHALTGSGGADLFLVGGGSGTLDGGGGNDRVVFTTDNAANANPVVVTQSGGATLLAQAGGPSLSVRNMETIEVAALAGTGLNVDASASNVGLSFVLSDAADTARGGAGVDVFTVASAARGTGDVWTGGGGADLFSFAGIGALSGTITDLEASDTIQVTGLGPYGRFIGGQDFTGAGNEFRYLSGSGLTALLGDADGDMVADSILLITNGAFVLAETSPTPGVLRIVGQLPPNDAGDNVVTGTDGIDYLDGGAGNDTIDGRGGDDVINGGDDDDHLVGGGGRDTIHGGDGDDVLDGGADSDFVFGDDGDDAITATGATGADGEWLTGGYGNDTITAANGLYRLIGDVGGSTPDDGDDRLTLTGGASDSWVTGGGGNDVLLATGTGTILLDGGTGDDDLTVGGFTNGHVSLGTGNDTLRILSGGGFILDMAETFGSGRDRVVIDSTIGFRVTGMNAGEQGDVLDLGAYGADPFGTGVLTIAQEAIDTVIRVVATGATIRLEGMRAANLSAYNLGVANPLFAPQGMTIDDAFANDPTIEWASQLTGADGNDTIRGFGGDDTLLGSGGNDRLEGGSGADLLDGGSGNDWLDGGDGDDVLQGGAGDDRIDNFAGADTIRGGTGDDVVHVSDAATQVIEGEGEGVDTVITSVSYTLAAGSEVEQLQTADPLGTSPIALTGNELANVVTGNAGANALDGAGGADWLNGGGGADMLTGGEGHDSVWGGDGDDLLSGGDGDDTLWGGAGVDTASYAVAGAGVEIDLSILEDQNTRGAGTDTLVSIENVIGSGFADVLAGNAAANVLTGGGGDDHFVFDGLGARDTIGDFAHGDVIDLSRIDANGALAGDAAFAFIGDAAFGGVAGQLRVAGSGFNWTVEADINGDGTADFSIAVVTQVSGMVFGSSDFLL